MYISKTSLCELEVKARSLSFSRQCRNRHSTCPQMASSNRSIDSVVIADFRDEVYASLASLLKQLGLDIYRAENATELATQVVRNNPDLVLLSATQPDESSWLTSAKLRLVDSTRPVWIYAPKPASALDQWLSMAGIDEVIVYGGVLNTLVDSLRDRILQKVSLKSDVV